MKNNNLHKNQPNAQAFGDDALENVSGGWKIVSADLGPSKESCYDLYQSEIKKLENHGYKVEKTDYGYRVSNKANWSISPKDIKKVLGYSSD